MEKFLEDPNILMLLVNQHHNFTHNKILSLPLGANDPKLMFKVLKERILLLHAHKDPRYLLVTAGSST